MDPKDKTVYLGSQTPAERTTFILASLDDDCVVVDKTELQQVNKFISLIKTDSNEPEAPLTDDTREDLKLKLTATIKEKHLKKLAKIKADVTPKIFFFFLLISFLNYYCTMSIH